MPRLDAIRQIGVTEQTYPHTQHRIRLFKSPERSIKRHRNGTKPTHKNRQHQTTQGRKDKTAATLSKTNAHPSRQGVN